MHVASYLSCNIPMVDISDAQVLEDLILGIQQGNHKGVVNQPKALHTLLEKKGPPRLFPPHHHYHRKENIRGSMGAPQLH